MESVSLLQECTPHNETVMICPVPYIDLPPELIEANSSSSEDDTDTHGSRRRRDTAAEYSGGWNLLDRLWDFIRTGSWSETTSPRQHSRKKRAPVASISNMNVSMSLYLGFIMDKYPSLKNISKTKPNLRLELIPYTFQCDHTPVSFDPIVNPLIKIKVGFMFCFYFFCVSPLQIETVVLTSLYVSISTSTVN